VSTICVDEVLVIGSQGIHGTLHPPFPEAERSTEVDIATLGNDAEPKADLLDGSIGELSVFQSTFGRRHRRRRRQYRTNKDAVGRATLMDGRRSGGLEVSHPGRCHRSLSETLALSDGRAARGTLGPAGGSR